jgi:hypothetical protein
MSRPPSNARQAGIQRMASRGFSANEAGSVFEFGTDTINWEDSSPR